MQIGAAGGVAVEGPILVGVDQEFSRQLHRLHDLADIGVGKDKDRAAVALGQLEGLVGAVAHLLGRVGGEDDAVVAAVTGAVDDEIIVGLLRPDIAEAGAGALHVDHHRGQFGAGEIGEALGHQRQARPGGAGHHPGPGGGGAVEHGNRTDLALRLEEMAAAAGEQVGRGVGDFARRSDRIAEVVGGAAEQGPVHQGLVAFHQMLSHITPPCAVSCKR
jgi:hypothetical protein